MPSAYWVSISRSVSTHGTPASVVLTLTVGFANLPLMTITVPAPALVTNAGMPNRLSHTPRSGKSPSICSDSISSWSTLIVPSNVARLRPASTCTFPMWIESKLFGVDSRPLCPRSAVCRAVWPRARSSASSPNPSSTSPLARRRPLRNRPTELATLGGRNRPTSIAFVISTCAFEYGGSSPNVAASWSSPGSLPPLISALVRSMKPCSLTRSMPPRTSASVSRIGSSPWRSGTSTSRFARSSPILGAATNGPVSVIVPCRSSPPTDSLMHVRTVGPRFWTSRPRFHEPS